MRGEKGIQKGGPRRQTASASATTPAPAASHKYQWEREKSNACEAEGSNPLFCAHAGCSSITILGMLLGADKPGPDPNHQAPCWPGHERERRLL